MFFYVLPLGYTIPKEASSQVFLIEDNWNDWWEFKTMYSLYYADNDGERHFIGSVKIGQFNMEKDQKRPELPESFSELSDNFFSVGQDVSYYENLNNLGEDIRYKILNALNDFALKPDMYEKARGSRVTKVSLLRDVRTTSVVGQYRRLANGDATLTPYKFTYLGPNIKSISPRLELSFEVTPDSNPPTNIHILIGRNAVGKTHMLNNMIESLINEGSSPSRVGFFKSDTDISKEELFANVVSVSFSAFDANEPLPERRDKSQGIQYSYVGLKRTKKNDEKINRPPKSPTILKREFAQSLYACKSSAKQTRWLRAVSMLEADPIFKDANIASLLNEYDDDESNEGNYTRTDLRPTNTFIDEKNFKIRSEEFFDRLSSGHKIVLLTLTRLVETVEERTLVLLDEPEAHLHPPLLSAFTRALSDLLVRRNAVALIATHSPVILQEVPRSCVWKLRRSGIETSYTRTEIETFGENLGALTREIFELEVTYSGFYKMLRDAVKKFDDYDRIIEHFNNELGMEARAMIRALLSSKNKGDN